jgi:hypothetical protein
MSMTWNEFRKIHKGIDTEEISDLWSKYKIGEYNLEPKIEVKAMEELSIDDVGEMFGEDTKAQVAEQLAKIEAGRIDLNHGHDLDYIAEVEEEMRIEEEFAAQNKIADMIDEEHPQLLQDESEIKREEKEQEYLNTLNNPEKRTGLKSVTHW